MFIRSSIPSVQAAQDRNLHVGYGCELAEEGFVDVGAAYMQAHGVPFVHAFLALAPYMKKTRPTFEQECTAVVHCDDIDFWDNSDWLEVQ